MRVRTLCLVQILGLSGTALERSEDVVTLFTMRSYSLS